MKYTVKTLLVAAATAASSLALHAQAAIHSSTWTFDSTLNAYLGIDTPAGTWGSLNVTSPATSEQQYIYDPQLDMLLLAHSAVTTPVVDVQTDAAGRITSLQSSGGALISLLRYSPLSLGGGIGLSDFTIDLSNKQVHATITGNFTGVASHTAAALSDTTLTTIEHFHLFDIGTVLQSRNAAGDPVVTVSGLSITADGFDHLRSSLRLLPLGSSYFSVIDSYGTISATVPEPSTWLLAITGIAIVASTERKRSA